MVSMEHRCDSRDHDDGGDDVHFGLSTSGNRPTARAHSLSGIAFAQRRRLGVCGDGVDQDACGAHASSFQRQATMVVEQRELLQKR
ncbi:hypothetical protein FTX61_26450 [Nitriliruptoraceae bacterium ZYF776]|nr:hypothetical protein [Profundirhabdus halotolerans]